MRHEHHGLSAQRQPDTSRDERPEPGEALHQHGLADSRRPAHEQRVARLEGEVKPSNEIRAVGGSHLDAGHRQRPVDGARCGDLAEGAGTGVLLDQAVEPDHRRAVTRELVVGLPEERQRVVDGDERGRRLDHVAEGDPAREQPRRLNHIRQRVDRLAHGQIPAGETHHPAQPVPVIGHHLRQPPAEQSAFDGLAAVQPDGGAGVANPHQRVSEARVAQLVEIAQLDQRSADDERDDGGRQHIGDDDPEQGARQGEPTDRQGARQLPQDRTERDHRQHRPYGTEQQCVARAVRRVVRLSAHPRGEDVDVLLDPLVGVVARVTEELPSVVGEVTEPVIDQPAAQPDSPPHDEALHQVHVGQAQDDVHDSKNQEDSDGHPEPVDAGVGDVASVGGDSLQGDLQRREDVVGVVTDQDRDANSDDGRGQQQRQHDPDHQALAADEVRTADSPELAAPFGQPPDQHENHDQARRGDGERDKHPDGGVEKLATPVDRGLERGGVHRATPPSAGVGLRRSYPRSRAAGVDTLVPKVDARWAVRPSVSTPDER